MKKSQSNRQQVVCEFIAIEYLREGRLRHDVVSNKVQIVESRKTKDKRPLRSKTKDKGQKSSADSREPALLCFRNGGRSSISVRRRRWRR